MADTYNVLYEVAQEFSNQTGQEILQELTLIKSQISQALFKIKNINRRKIRENKAQVLKEGYAIIMNIRERLLGQTINYRLYLTSQDTQETKILEMSTQEILDLVSYERSGLRLKRFSDEGIRQLAKNSNNNNLYAKYMDQHMSTIMNSLKQVTISAGQSLQSAYIVANEKYKNLPNIKTAKGTLRFFNRGWIFQALDQTFYDLYSNSKENNQMISNNEFEGYYFTKALNYDNLVGFKGGDVGETQIKTNAAALMSQKTINRYLIQLQQLFNNLGEWNKEQIINKIQQLFTDISNPDDIINNSIDKNVNAILSSLQH